MSAIENGDAAFGPGSMSTMQAEEVDRICDRFEAAALVAPVP